MPRIIPILSKIPKSVPQIKIPSLDSLTSKKAKITAEISTYRETLNKEFAFGAKNKLTELSTEAKIAQEKLGESSRSLKDINSSIRLLNQNSFKKIHRNPLSSFQGDSAGFSTKFQTIVSPFEPKNGLPTKFQLHQQKSGWVNSLRRKKPEIAKQWDKELNKGIGYTPDNVHFKGCQRIHWKCEEGEDHVWQSAINVRTRPKKALQCPFCANVKLCRGNSLAVKNQQVAKMWRTDLNGGLEPDKVLFTCKEKVWWQHGKDSDPFKEMISVMAFKLY